MLNMLDNKAVARKPFNAVVGQRGMTVHSQHLAALICNLSKFEVVYSQSIPDPEAIGSLLVNSQPSQYFLLIISL